MDASNLSEIYSPKRIRHGMEHHLHNRIRRGDIVLQQPLPCHADRSIAIQPDAVQQLGVQCISAQLLLCPASIPFHKEFNHIGPHGILGIVLINPFHEDKILPHPVHALCRGFHI